jgi:hypothetical protein
MSTTVIQKANASWQWGFWGQWIIANAVSETVGLGATLLLGMFLLVQMEPTIGVIPAAMLGVLVATVIEGLVVGTAQWLVLHRPLRNMRWSVWALATALGAFVAWTLGMVPSTILSSGADTATSAPVQISNLNIYTLAAGLGLIAGALLGIPQWQVLRRYLLKASWWVLANALAWMLGMVMIFISINVLPAEGLSWQGVLLLLMFIAGAGALVGAVHGLFLIWLLRQRRPYVTISNIKRDGDTSEFTSKPW